MMLILLKLIKDFRFAKSKLLLMLLAAGISSWGISSVVYSYMMAERDFQVNFMRTFPADIELFVENHTQDLENKFLSDVNVMDIERREALGGRIKNASGEWMPLILYAVDDLDNTRYDKFRILKIDPGPKDKILIETNAEFYLDPDDDSIEVQFPEKGEIVWKKGGVAHDARLAPARMERVVYAYATSINMVDKYLVEGRRRLLVETNISSNLVALHETAERLKTIAKQEGSEVIYAKIPTPGKHIHQNIVDGISFFQKCLGTILSVMGIILLTLILLTWIFPQIVQVGVMKSIGASTKRIFTSYLIVLFFVIVVGLLIGMPLGYKTATLYNGFVGSIQNFEPVVDLLPFHIHGIVALTAIVLPLLFGIRPLSKAANTSVNEAMNKTFYTPHKAFFRISQTVMNNTKFKYAINNLFRNSQRTILMVFLTAIGVGLYFTGSNLEYSARTEMNEFAKTAKYGLRVKFSRDLEKSEIAFLSELPFVSSISPMQDRRVTYRPPGIAHTEDRMVRILSSDHKISDDFVVKGEVRKNCRKCLYIGGIGMRQDFEGVGLGTPIELTYQSGESEVYIYSGIFKDMAAIGSPFFLIDDEMTQSFNALALEIKPGYSPSEVSQAVDDALLNNGIDLLDMLSVDMRLAQLQGHLNPTYLILKVMGIFTVLLGFLGLIIVLNLTIQERTREIGIMKSIGCSFRQISGMFRLEFAL